MSHVLVAMLLLGGPIVSERFPRAEDPAKIKQLIADLHDDDVRWNAMRAQGGLFQIGLETVPWLRKALESDDRQQRHCAANVLRRLVEAHGLKPSRRLLQVTVEGLADDHIHGTQNTANATGGRYFLDEHIEQAAPLLVAALGSPDRQQRFLSAYLLGTNGVLADLERTSAVLIGHLADNDIDTDACSSCYALYRLGKSVIPYLEPHRESPDRQQREAIALLILDLENPPRTPSELLGRMTFHSLTKHHADPCIEHSAGWFEDLGQWRIWPLFHEIWGDTKTPVPSLARLRARHGDDLDWKLDGKEPGFLQVAVGLAGVRFDRLLTLRVHLDGRVTRRVTDELGATRWVVEFTR